MKKIIVVTLELDTVDYEPTEKEIKLDLEREINCASFSYKIERIEFLNEMVKAEIPLPKRRML